MYIYICVSVAVFCFLFDNKHARCNFIFQPKIVEKFFADTEMTPASIQLVNGNLRHSLYFVRVS